MKKKLTINASAEEAFAIVSFCERKGISPLDVLLNACGPDHEPHRFVIESLVEERQRPKKVNIDDPTLLRSKRIRLENEARLAGVWNEIDDQKPIPRPYGDQNKAYLELLSQLFKWDKEKVSAKLQNRHGTRCLYFSQNRDEISRQSKPIPDSGNPLWYANTHLSADQKEKILYKLLVELQFTPTYSRFISGLVNNKRPPIAGLRFVSDETPK